MQLEEWDSGLFADSATDWISGPNLRDAFTFTNINS